MSLALSITSVSEPIGLLELHLGDVILVGRAEGLGASFPQDLQMSSQHFEIEVRADSIHLFDLRSTNGTFVNGERVNEAALTIGDEVLAGQTIFVVVDSDQAAVQSANAEQVLASEYSFESKTQELCEALTLSDDAVPLIAENESVDQFIDSLKKNRLYMDALRVLSHAMGTITSVLWSCECLREHLQQDLSDLEMQAIDAATAWADKPTEKSANAAHECAAQLKNEGPAAMVAQAAYWGMGNMAPPGKPSIPVEQQLPSQSIAGALTLVAVNGTPKEAVKKYEDFISRALKIAAN